MAPKDRLDVLRLERDGDAFVWRESGAIWGAVELSDKSNLFSRVGIGARAATVVTVPRGLTLYDALRWQGKHLFLTMINTVGPARMEIAAALVEPVMCTATRPEKVRDEYGAPSNVQKPLYTFPGCLTEKYLGRAVLAPQVELTETLVLVAPKPIELLPGDLVETGRGVYAVSLPHMLDEYKNEYEIIREWEA